MKLTDRQEEIIAIVKDREPISADLIAEALDLSKSTIRSDLAVLTMTGILDARPRVGYIYSGLSFDPLLAKTLYDQPVKDIMQVPLLVKQTDSVQDGVTKLFIYDAGSLYVIDDQDQLVGLVSRKDLLRVLLASKETKLALGLVMTRMPNIISIHPEITVYQAASLLRQHEIDSLPVVQDGQVVGKVSKTSLLNHYLNHYPGSEH